MADETTWLSAQEQRWVPALVSELQNWRTEPFVRWRAVARNTGNDEGMWPFLLALSKKVGLCSVSGVLTSKPKPYQDLLSQVQNRFVPHNGPAARANQMLMSTTPLTLQALHSEPALIPVAQAGYAASVIQDEGL